MTNPELRKQVLSLVHLVGCQAHDAGWNGRAALKPGDNPLNSTSLDKIDDLEKTLVDELTALIAERETEARIDEWEKVLKKANQRIPKTFRPFVNWEYVLARTRIAQLSQDKGVKDHE